MPLLVILAAQEASWAASSGLRPPALEPRGEMGGRRLPGARSSVSPGVATLSLPCRVTEGHF